MDKKVSRKGDAANSQAHEVVSDLKVRSEGVRIKHRLGKNSIKLYDKAYSEFGAVLRPELTLNAPQQFRVFRHKTGQQVGTMQWRQMRAGIADLHAGQKFPRKRWTATAPRWPEWTILRPCSN